MQNETSVFNKRKEYESQIEEKVEELKRLCNKANIPMFFAACLSNDEKETNYNVELLSPGVCGVKLTKDWFSRFVNVTMGFDTVAPSANISFDMDEINL